MWTAINNRRRRGKNPVDDLWIDRALREFGKDSRGWFVSIGLALLFWLLGCTFLVYVSHDEGCDSNACQ